MPENQEINGTSEILSQYQKAESLAKAGLLEQITPENFPCLNPIHIARVQMLAIKTQYWELNSNRVFTRNDQTASSSISNKMSGLQNLAAEVAKEAFKEVKPSDSQISLFWLSPDENITLRTALELGFIEAINELTFPSLAGLSQETITRLKLLAIANAQSQLKSIENMGGNSIGFINSRGLQEVKEFAQSQEQQLGVLLQSLLVKID